MQLNMFQGSKTSVKMIQSHLALQNFEKNVLKEVRKESKKRSERNGISDDLTSVAKVESFGVGVFNANLVGLKRIRKSNIEMNRDVRVELKQVRHNTFCTTTASQAHVLDV